MLQNIWQGMISSSSCSCNTYLLLLVNLFLDQKYYINLKYSEIKLLGLDEEKTWIVAVGRSCREKTKVIEAGLWICNFEHIVSERHGVMVTFGNPGKKRKLSRKRKVRKKIKGRVGKKGEILQRWLFLAQTEQFYKARGQRDKFWRWRGAFFRAWSLPGRCWSGLSQTGLCQNDEEDNHHHHL